MNVLHYSSATTPRRVLMVSDAVGGVWQYSLELARALSAAGTATTLVSMGAELSAARARELEPIPGVRHINRPCKLEWMHDPWDDVDRTATWLMTIADAEDVDVVHLNGFAQAAFAWRQPVVVVGHSCVASWWASVERTPIPESWDVYRERVRAGLRLADAVVAPSHAMLSSLERQYGPLPRSTVVPNARSERDWRPARKEPFVLAAGRLWDPAKNLALLDRAAARLDWPVVVCGPTVGPGGERASADAVEVRGDCDATSLQDLMGRAAIYALPARYEPFGLSVLEAALSGCALVLGDIPSLRENWDGVADFVSPDDDEGLATAVRALAREPARLEARGRAARERAVRFTPERQREGYLDAYARAIDHRLRSASSQVATA